MQEHLMRALTFLHGAFSFLVKGIKELVAVAWSRKLISLGVIVVLIGAGIAASIIFKAAAPGANDERRSVTLLSVSELSAAEPVSVIGEIRSVNEANVAPDVPGTVSAVYRSLGDFVGAGTIIAQLKNDTQRAGVAQAQAALDKVKSGVAISGIGLGTAENSLTSAIESSKNTITTAYTSIDTAVHEKADAAFSNPDRGDAKLLVSTSNSQAALNAENSRVSIQPILDRQASAKTPTDVESLLSELEILSSETTKVRDFLASLVTALNSAIASGSVTESQIAGYRANTSAALASVNALRSSVTATIENLKAKRAGVAIANESLSGSTGENADIRSAEANLAAAQAGLEKTIIRAPISGTINRLDLDVGSFVNASVPVVYITNARGLEAVVYVSERDIADIAVGARVIIGGKIEGKVARVASALDPVTKKAEIRISIPESAALISGSSASVSIARTARQENIAATPTVPLSAIKITPEGSVVFTVTNGALVSHPVILGALRGSKVEIASGLTADMQIVEDARGLKEGQEVTIKAE